jgi:hypothetical protein
MMLHPVHQHPFQRRAIGLVLCTLLASQLTACTGTLTGPGQPARAGTYLGTLSIDTAPIVQDVRQQLQALWPAAKTRLVFEQPLTDNFSLSLVQALREAGYAVQESAVVTGTPATSLPVSAPAEGSATQALPLRFVLDRVTPDLMRLTLWDGQRSMTRAYRVQDGQAVVAGQWSRMDRAERALP